MARLGLRFRCMAAKDCLQRSQEKMTRRHACLQVLVEMNPAASARAFIRERLCWHEIVGCLHADAHVDFISTIGKFDLLPELWILRVILAIVELLPHILDKTKSHAPAPRNWARGWKPNITFIHSTAQHNYATSPYPNSASDCFARPSVLDAAGCHVTGQWRGNTLKGA